MTSWAEDRRTAGLESDYERSEAERITAAWRVDLAAARMPATEEQQAWDRRFQDRYHRFRVGGKTPAQAASIAWRLTEDQQGPRPTNTTEET